MERLIYNRISPVIDPQLPQEPAGFRPGLSTLDHVAKLTSDIEQAFDGNLKGGAVFADMTAAYDMAPMPHTETASDATEPTYGALHVRAHLKPQSCCDNQ